MKLLRWTPVLAALCFAAPAWAAGTISFSLSQQLDTQGKPLSGCFLYLIQAGTVSTPQSGYQDTALTLPHPNPLRCDSAGRLPQFFLADGEIKVRLASSTGITQVEADNVLVIGPSAGGGGGGGQVDPTTTASVGDVKVRYDTGPHVGWVRMNGRTIGSATSGATERANADTQALFTHLWHVNASLEVSGGRGASAAADWAANKAISLPDARSRSLTALADMGNTASTLLNGVSWQFGNASTLGSFAGTSFRSILHGNLPSVTLATNIFDPGHVHAYAGPASPTGGAINTGAVPYLQQGYSAAATTNPSTTGITANTPLGGSNVPLETLSPVFLVTVYLKL